MRQMLGALPSHVADALQRIGVTTMIFTWHRDEPEPDQLSFLRSLIADGAVETEAVRFRVESIRSRYDHATRRTTADVALVLVPTWLESFPEAWRDGTGNAAVSFKVQRINFDPRL